MWFPLWSFPLGLIFCGLCALQYSWGFLGVGGANKPLLYEEIFKPLLLEPPPKKKVHFHASFLSSKKGFKLIFFL